MFLTTTLEVLQTIAVNISQATDLVAGGDSQLVGPRIEGNRGDGPQEVVRVDALARVHIPQPHLQPVQWQFY